MTVAQVILKDESGRSLLDAESAITSENVGDFRIPAERVERAAAKLRSLGFSIESSDEMCLSVSAPDDLFEKIFHIRASDAPGLKADVPEQLDEFVAGVVIPQAPDFFP